MGTNIIYDYCIIQYIVLCKFTNFRKSEPNLIIKIFFFGILFSDKLKNLIPSIINNFHYSPQYQYMKTNPFNCMKIGQSNVDDEMNLINLENVYIY